MAHLIANERRVRGVCRAERARSARPPASPLSLLCYVKVALKQLGNFAILTSFELGWTYLPHAG